MNYEDEAHTTIEIWCAELDHNAQRMAAFVALLSPDERARAERFRTAPHRDRFIAARAITRILLGARLGQAPEAVEIVYNAHGKPTVVRARPHFNIAHTGGLLLCALADDAVVGVDVEDTRRTVEIASIARSFFAPEEAALLAATEAEEQRALFFRLWTRKEAYLKARGQGMARGGLNIALPIENRAAFTDESGAHWTIISFSPAQHMQAALVTSASALELLMRTFTLPDQ